MYGGRVIDRPTAIAVDRALLEVEARFDQLLHSIRHLDAKAVGHWSAAETAAHVATISYFDAGACGSQANVPFAHDDLIERAEHAQITDVEHLNAEALRRFTERDPHRLAEHVAANVEAIAVAVATDPDRPTTWLGGVDLPIRAVAGHLLLELAIHGLDISRSQHLAWDVAEPDARIVLDEFLFPFLEAASHKLASVTAKPVRVELRVLGLEPKVIDIGAGHVSVGLATQDRADVVFTTDAATLVLLMFERLDPVSVLASRRLKIGGRRPWRMLRFRRQMSMP